MINERGLYVIEDIAFVNTSLFTEAARHYKKHGCYTFAPEGSREHTEFWNIEEDRRINGMKVPGKLVNGILQEVHITGKHYGFLNFGRIFMTKDTDDVDEKELFFQTGNKPKHTRKVGKKSIDFPRFIDGQYHWWKSKDYAVKNGLHRVAAKARRKGFSYMEGFDCADEINMNPDVTVIAAAFNMDYINKGNQILPMAKRYLDWFELQTDFNRGYLKEEKEHIKLGYKLEGEGHKEFGYQSSFLGVSLMNNPDAAAGKDAVLIKFEESGKNPILKDALSITMSTTEDGSLITGNIDIFGTGGTKNANWADFEEIFYNPEAYGCMAFANIWDEGYEGTPSGFFYPQEIGDPVFTDEHGNSQVKRARESHEQKIEIQKRIKTQSAFIRWCAQRARSPREAFSSGADNIFPSAEIIEQRSKVEHNPDYKYLARAGELVRTTGGIRFKLNDIIRAEGIKIHEPIFNHPLKNDQDVHGCYVEWFSPYKDPQTGLIPKGLYRIWHDPYAHDIDSKDVTIKHSLGSTYVYERVNNLTPGRGDYLVACFNGRPSTIDEYNETLMKIAEYWNAEIMFENDRGDVKGFFARKKKSYLLADEPDLEWIAALQGKTNRHKGINMTDKRKAQAAIYLRDWLLESRGKDAFGNDRINLHYIYDAGLLSELLKWNIKGNFDRVSASLVGMFDIKECFNRQIKPPKDPNKESFFNKRMFVNN